MSDKSQKKAERQRLQERARKIMLENGFTGMGGMIAASHMAYDQIEKEDAEFKATLSTVEITPEGKMTKQIFK